MIAYADGARRLDRRGACQVVGVEVVGESGLLKLKPSKTGFEVW